MRWIVHTKTRSVEVNIERCSPTLRGKVVLVFINSSIKTKKVTFCKLKKSLSRNFVYNLQTLSSAFLRFCLQIHHENNFLPTSNHQQAKARRFRGICLFDCFIYRSNFVFRKCLETRRHLGSCRKTVNSQGYSELPGANQNARKLLLTGLVNTKKPPYSERIF